MSLSLIQDGSVGDNKEFAVAAISDVNIHIGVSGKTSADDTATDKYFDNLMSTDGAYCSTAKAFYIRSDQTVQIVGMNNTTFTNPITVVINKGHRELFDVRQVFKIVIRTTVVNTNLKIRVK